MVTHPASSLAQDRESSPAETSVLTTMLRRQLIVSNAIIQMMRTGSAFATLVVAIKCAPF